MTSDDQTILEPGDTIGILGSGQLGRMLALAAARLGLKTHIYCPEAGPAFAVATTGTAAGWNDSTALKQFAASAGTVTCEFENVPVAAVELLEEFVPVRPGSRALSVAQDRLTEKDFLVNLNIPVAWHAAVASKQETADAVADFAGPAVLKARRNGYDGKGQACVAGPDDIAGIDAAWSAVGGAPAVLEGVVGFDFECSVIIARDIAGNTAAYDITANEHKDGILRRSRVPALNPTVAGKALECAETIAGALNYVGVLAVEMFVTGPDIVVNEIAPRVHNSGHWTEDGCLVSQFEQHIRAVAGWQLGDTARHSDIEMENLIGDDVLRWKSILAEPGARLHLYGKDAIRPGRKMGHVNRLK